MVLTPPLERSATIRLRGFPWTRSEELLVPVAVYLGDPGVLLNGCDVLELSWSWGAGRDAGVTTTVDAGTGVLRLFDPDRKYDPLVASGLAGIATTVRVLVAGVPAFRGRVDDVDHDLGIASLTLVDDVGSLAGVQFVETSVPAETSSARVTRILDLAAWPADRRDIGAGGVALQAGTVAADAWSELLEVTRNELGAVWLGYDGKVYWRNRAQAWAAGVGTEYLENGSFEVVDDAGATYPYPTGWQAYPDAQYVVAEATADAVEGDRVLWMGAHSVAHDVYRLVGLTPGATCTLSAYAGRAAGTSEALTVSVLESPSQAVLAVLAWSAADPERPAMTKKTTTFVAPASGQVNVQVKVAVQTAPAHNWRVDLVSVTAPPFVLAAELGCPPSLAPLTGLALTADQSSLVNVLAAARRGGSQAVVSDAPSLARYGRHSHVQNDLEVATDGDRSLWQGFYLPRSREPARGVASVTMRPTASAIATLLGLPYGSLVRVMDSGHGPDIDVRARWLGARWTATPDAIEVTATLGQDQSIGPVARVLVIDTPAEWTAATMPSGSINTEFREPGVAVIGGSMGPYHGTPPPVLRTDDELEDLAIRAPVDEPPPPESTPGILPAQIVEEGGHPPELPGVIIRPKPARRRKPKATDAE